jgi:acetoin utilization protein AcuB
MLVRNWMRKNVVTIDAGSSVQEAAHLLKEHDIRALPVMEGGRLAGIVMEGDLKRAIISDYASLELPELLSQIARTKIRDIMTSDPVTLTVDHTLQDAAEFLLDKKVSHAPVVDDEGELAGIITQKDIFRVLVSLTGARKKGIQVGIQVENRPGSIKEATDIMRNYGCRMVSILTTYGDESGLRHVYVRACECDRQRLRQMKNELKAKAKLLYFVDDLKKKKEFYEEYERPSSEWFVG